MLMQGRKINAQKVEVEQGTDEWLDLRRSHITASESLIIMGLSPWRTREQLLSEKLGLIEPQKVNSSMLRGQLLEPKARACAEEMLNTLFISGVYKSHQNPWMLASLDGVCIDNQILLEIKCTNKKNHEIAKNGKIPDYYMPQIQHQISVCDVDQCYYFSFDGSSGVIVVVDRDEEFIKRMIEMEKEFYQEMTS